MPNRRRFRGCLAVLMLTALAFAGDLHAAETQDQSDPPDAYELTIRLSDKAVELKGDVAGDDARAAIVTAASKAFPDLPLTMVLVETPAAPPGFTRAAVKAIGLLSFLAEGEATLSGTQVDFSGSALHPKAKTAFTASLSGGWPDGFSATAAAVEEGPSGPGLDLAACEDSLHDVTETQAIEFEAGRADVAAHSRHQIDRVAHVALRCPDTLIAVAGHTDSDGSHEKNYGLSLNRARTVIDLLVADGVPAERFTALGYGESRPLASNGSLAGKARNRRIEFVLRD